MTSIFALKIKITFDPKVDSVSMHDFARLNQLPLIYSFEISRFKCICTMTSTLDLEGQGNILFLVDLVVAVLSKM